MTVQTVARKKNIIDRRALSQVLSDKIRARPKADVRGILLETLKDANEAGQAAICALAARPDTNGRALVRAHSYLIDELLLIAWHVITNHLAPRNNPTRGERLALVAVGGYGRQEMAPHSDVDLLFLTPYKRTPWAEQAVEHLLYLLWDMGLKVGHATRSISELIAMCKDDLTVRTAFLEARLLSGDADTFTRAKTLFETDIVATTKPDFIQAKLNEREVRHAKMGDSRFHVEPNIKESKGGLRDLQTLYWIAKYVYGVDEIKDLVSMHVFTADEYRAFRQAETFLWNVRCHLHYLTGRAEERLTFAVQTDLAVALNYMDRGGQRGVERFMKHYFLMAKRVGDLTHIFIAHLEQEHVRKPLLRMPRLRHRKIKDPGLKGQGRWFRTTHNSYFDDDPARLLTIFEVMDETGLDIHPDTLRQIRTHRRLVDAKLRRDPYANQAFLNCLSSKNDPERVLRRMNETGIFGRFVPDFGKIVGQMQFDMYHNYTVDEHTIRAVSLLSQIERGLQAEEHPISTRLMPTIVQRRALYTAVLLHDIAKGRGGDHSVLGEKVAKKLCPRLGMTPAETETVAWLVRYHLLMSHFAFKRDLSDPKTVTDFAAEVKSPERLRMLLILTVVDIKAVGPKVWNSWKGQLLTELFNQAFDMLAAGRTRVDQRGRVAAQKSAALARLTEWTQERFDAVAQSLPDTYWLSEPPELMAANIAMLEETRGSDSHILCHALMDDTQSVTYFSVCAPDHPGISYRIAGAICFSGASIAGAKIHTTNDGMAVDNFLIQSADGLPLDDPARLKRIEKRVRDALEGKLRLDDQYIKPALSTSPVENFNVAPLVLIDNNASDKFTVIEVNALDRPTLLYKITRSLFYAKVTVRSAHIATYGERAVDVFYITDLLGQKISNTNRIRALERRLLEVLRAAEDAAAA